MQVPIRKPGKYTHLKNDPHLTAAKLTAFKNELDKLINVSRPPAVREVKRLAEMGDFSENAAYQLAKGKLRGINQRILDLENIVKHAIVIEPTASNGTVRLGTTVTIEIDHKPITYLILGSAETNPSKGVISHNSPIGAALIGHRVGDIVQIKLKDTTLESRIVAIE